jgi:protein phosphatase 1 regulatory subunit 7
MQSNRVTKIEGLEELEALEELYLSHNGVSKLENLEKNVSTYGASHMFVNG